MDKVTATEVLSSEDKRVILYQPNGVPLVAVIGFRGSKSKCEKAEDHGT